MIWKLLLLAFSLAGGWMLFTRAVGGRRRGAEELTPCPICGLHKRKRDLCDCDRAPTP